MSLHIHHMNLIKSLRSLHRLWIFTSFSWALPDLRVGASNSRFCRCGSNLWLASTLSIGVSKLQPKESPLLSLSGDIFCCVTLTVPRAVCAVPATASPTSLSLWVTSPKEASPLASQAVPAHERQDAITPTTACMELTMSPPKCPSQKLLGNGEREGRGENSQVTDDQDSTPAPDTACPKRLLPLNYCPRKNSWSTAV